MLDYNRYLVSCNLVGNKSIYPASQVWWSDRGVCFLRTPYSIVPCVVYTLFRHLSNLLKVLSGISSSVSDLFLTVRATLSFSLSLPLAKIRKQRRFSPYLRRSALIRLIATASPHELMCLGDTIRFSSKKFWRKSITKLSVRLTSSRDRLAGVWSLGERTRRIGFVYMTYYYYQGLYPNKPCRVAYFI